MNAFFTLCLQPPIWLTYISGITSILALIVALFYFMKPRLTIKDESKEGGEIRIRCTNDNYFPAVIKDIKCDIVLSDNETFDITETVELCKDWITGIKHKDYYVFKSKKPKTKKYIKVRILALNYLGIKKYYEFPENTLKMKTRDIFKRIYYALTVTGLMVFVTMFIYWPMTRFEMTESLWLYKGISLSVLLSLGACWIMTRHNKPSHFRWYAGVIIAITLIYIYIPFVSYYMHRLTMELEVHTQILLAVYCLCVAVSTFMSNTKYHNILPNQNKGVSTMFRVLSWTGQIAVWGYGVAVLVTVLWFSR